MYTRYVNILNELEYSTCRSYLESSKWHYGRKSNKEDMQGFWGMELKAIDFFNNVMFERIQSKTETAFDINLITANGQTFGQDGSWHYDDDAEDAYTFLYYANQAPDVSEVGETLFRNGEEIITAPPIFNSGILFKSSTVHRGLGPRQGFNGLRITVAYKLVKVGALKKKKTLV